MSVRLPPVTVQLALSVSTWAARKRFIIVADNRKYHRCAVATAVTRVGVIITTRKV